MHETRHQTEGTAEEERTREGPLDWKDLTDRPTIIALALTVALPKHQDPRRESSRDRQRIAAAKILFGDPALGIIGPLWPPIHPKDWKKTEQKFRQDLAERIDAERANARDHDRSGLMEISPTSVRFRLSMSALCVAVDRVLQDDDPKWSLLRARISDAAIEDLSGTTVKKWRAKIPRKGDKHQRLRFQSWAEPQDALRPDPEEVDHIRYLCRAGRFASALDTAGGRFEAGRIREAIRLEPPDFTEGTSWIKTINEQSAPTGESLVSYEREAAAFDAEKELAELAEEAGVTGEDLDGLLNWNGPTQTKPGEQKKRRAAIVAADPKGRCRASIAKHAERTKAKLAATDVAVSRRSAFSSESEKHVRPRGRGGRTT